MANSTTQQLVLIGNLARDPDVSTAAGGTVVARFGIAYNYKKGDDEHVTWFNCVAFNKNADAIGKFFKKGKPIVIFGRVGLNTYETSDGNKRTDLSVMVDRWTFAPGDYSDREEREHDDAPSGRAAGKGGEKGADVPW